MRGELKELFDYSEEEEEEEKDEKRKEEEEEQVSHNLVSLRVN